MIFTGISAVLSTRAKLFEFCHKLMQYLFVVSVPVVVFCEFMTRRQEGWRFFPLIIYLGHVIYFLLLATSLLAAIITWAYVFLVIENEGLGNWSKPCGSSPDEGTQTQVPNLVAKYSALLLLCKFFNSSMGAEIIPSCKYMFSILSMGMFSLAVQLESTDVTTLMFKCTFFMISIYGCGVVIIAATMMSTVWNSGQIFVQNLKCMTTTQLGENERKMAKTMVRSLAPIRVTIGGMYHMEKEAKLTLINFVVTGTTNMLLILQRKTSAM
jgi:hypothetical protein